MARIVEVAWPSHTGGQTVVDNHIDAGEVVAFHFKTPSPDPGAKGSIGLVEYNGPPDQRSGSLSAIAGDLTGGCGPGTVFAHEVGPTIYFYGDDMPPPSDKHGKTPKETQLKAGTDYYFNVKNDNQVSGGVRVTFTKPKHK